MKLQDWSIRGRLERFLARYNVGGQTVDLQPFSVDTGLTEGQAIAAGVTVTVTVRPATDFPFLWIGNSIPQTIGGGAGTFLRPKSILSIRPTILKNAWQLGSLTTGTGLTGYIPLQVFGGYAGKPSLFVYPYFFEAHDEIRFDYFAEAPGTLQSHSMIGYKAIPRG